MMTFVQTAALICVLRDNRRKAQIKKKQPIHNRHLPLLRPPLLPQRLLPNVAAHHGHHGVGCS
jgi:hypothetical protein